MSCNHGCCATNREHWLSIAIGAAALPSRRTQVAATAASERVLDKDLDAYKRLRQDGLQPKHVKGSHRLEKHANHRLEVEANRLITDT